MKFAIIGLTGPLESGCTTAAEFLSKGLTNYKKDVEKMLPEIKATIGEYYRYLKRELEQINDLDLNFDKFESESLIKPGLLHDEYHKMTELNLKHSQDDLKIINRRLRGLIIKRDIYRAFVKVCQPENCPNFTVISMSDMIMKLVLQNISCITEESKKDNIKSHVRNKLHQSKIDKIKEFAKDYNPIFTEFDKIVFKKDYKKLSQDVCNKIDQAFSAIRDLKHDIHSSEHTDIEWLQHFGDNLRATGNPFNEYEQEEFKSFEYLDILSIEANKCIKYTRRREDGKANNFFVIDTFRNPEEVYFFRKRYGSFFLCSIYAHKNKREARHKKSEFNKLDKRDQGVGNSPRELHKQNVPGCVLISDYAINNEGSKDDLKSKLARLLILIDNPGWITPTTDEVFMHMAYSLSLRSRCLSRQVGAIITNSDGFIIGAGWNDVGSGQLGCSLKCLEDYTMYSSPDTLLSVWEPYFADFRNAGLLEEYADEDYFCFKDVQSEMIVKEKIDNIINYDELVKDIEDDDAKKLVKRKCKEMSDEIKSKLNIKRLEFARSLHAEENAILQVATYGGMGIKGGTIYTTTFPCELCAKKIYQSGLERIVYTEPYPESISESIFLKDGVRKIMVEQFEGVKSNSFYGFFKSRLDRKDMQRINDIYEELS